MDHAKLDAAIHMEHEMAGVRRLLLDANASGSQKIEGFIVLLNNRVHLIDYEYEQPWQSTPNIELSVEDLKFALMLQVAQMGGGESMFFHRAIVVGEYSDQKIVPIEIKIKNYDKEDWFNIDFSPDVVAKGKENFLHLEDHSSESALFWSRSKKHIDVADGKINLALDRDDILIIINALNEVCNGIEVFEFETRVDASHERVKELLIQFRSIIDALDTPTTK